MKSQPRAPLHLRFPSKPLMALPSLPRAPGASHLSLLLLLVAAAVLLANFLASRRSAALAYALRALPEEPGSLRARAHAPVSCASGRRPGPKPLYVFLHLHKTGGNSLKTSLFAFARRNGLGLHHTCHATHADGLLSAWWFHRVKKTGAGLDCNLDVLAAMPVEKRDRIDLVMGHQFVGAHSLFPHRDVRYFTFVRHPLARKVSHFLHFERGKAGERSLARYLVERNRNYMTKRLATDVRAGELATDLRARFVDLDSFAARAALRAAKRNLIDRFFFVGLQERYAESVCVLARILNAACGRDGKLAGEFVMRPEKVVRKSVNQRGETMRKIDGMSKTLKAAVLRAESADVELYRFAERLFEEKMKMYPECRGAYRETDSGHAA